MLTISPDEQKIINALNANWAWIPGWIDSAADFSAGKIVRFSCHFDVSQVPLHATVYFTADTRYKLYVNGKGVAVGPALCGPTIWYYDHLDIAQYLKQGRNAITFVVVRYFGSSRGALPFERTAYPGLTVHGSINCGHTTFDLDSVEGWLAQTDSSVSFPSGLIDDGFLHINERISPTTEAPLVTLRPCNFKTLNGDILPWRLRPRTIPMPEESIVAVDIVRTIQSDVPDSYWTSFLSSGSKLCLSSGSRHVVELQAAVHSTAFLHWSFGAVASSQIKLKVMSSEGYELEPRSCPYFRTKADRLDPKNGYLIGPFDEAVFDIADGQVMEYEPFWFRTFRILRL